MSIRQYDPWWVVSLVHDWDGGGSITSYPTEVQARIKYRESAMLGDVAYLLHGMIIATTDEDMHGYDTFDTTGTTETDSVPERDGDAPDVGGADGDTHGELSRGDRARD